MRLRRLFALLVLALLLDGCTNRVFSEKPWFDSASAVPALVLRDGLWLTDDPECKVRETDPAERWPKCADWGVHRAGQSLRPQWTKSRKFNSSHWDYGDWSVDEDQGLLVAGDPMINQESDCALGTGEKAEEAIRGKVKPASEDKGDPRPDAEESKTKYCYDAVRLEVDGQGRIVSFEGLPVLCGPPPDDSSKSNVTSQPWPGVTIVKENCTVASEAVLRDVARRSYELAKERGFAQRAHWVRDGYR